MTKVLPLVVTTMVFLSFFVYIFSNIELEEVRANWNERRCEPLAMLIAEKVPTDPKVDASAFASENFNFCMGKIIDNALSGAFHPVKEIFTKQLNVAEKAQDSVNTLRKSATGLMTPITELTQGLFNKFKFILYQIFRIFFKIQSSIDRVYAISVATLFSGMAMFRGIQNWINFVIKVVLIILAILVALVIFLFFIMAPFVPTILATIAVLVATAAGAAAGGMAGSFCVAPETLVKLKEGWKEVQHVKAGDVLADGAVVEGVLEVMRKDAPCVDIHGVIISASHIVSFENQWIFAGDHPDAKPAKRLPKHLFCLNTSNRCWSVKTHQGEMVLRDWEELPEEEQEQEEDTMCSWEALIYELLNRQAIVSTAAWSAPGRGLLGGETMVECCARGVIPIRDVKIGDWIRDKESHFTQVLGVYHDTSELVPIANLNAAAWVWLDGKSVWRHPLSSVPLDATSRKDGYQLVTDSGTFVTHAGSWVRDFTEVGHDRIHETYSHTASRLSTAT